MSVGQAMSSDRTPRSPRFLNGNTSPPPNPDQAGEFKVSKDSGTLINTLDFAQKLNAALQSSPNQNDPSWTKVLSSHTDSQDSFLLEKGVTVLSA